MLAKNILQTGSYNKTLFYNDHKFLAQVKQYKESQTKDFLLAKINREYVNYCSNLI